MFALTKTYATRVQAVNAIRMLARNRQWEVLDTVTAGNYVSAKEASGGFVVNNAALNAAYKFVQHTASVATLLALTATSAARYPLLPLLHARKARTSNASAGARKRCTVVNGARRPLAGKTLLVWTVTEDLYKEANSVPTAAQVYAALCKLHAGFNKTTCNIQYYACRHYNGWEK